MCVCGCVCGWGCGGVGVCVCVCGVCGGVCVCVCAWIFSNSWWRNISEVQSRQILQHYGHRLCDSIQWELFVVWGLLKKTVVKENSVAYSSKTQNRFRLHQHVCTFTFILESLDIDNNYMLMSLSRVISLLIANKSTTDWLTNKGNCCFHSCLLLKEVVLHLLPQNNMFCALSQNNQYLLEK